MARIPESELERLKAEISLVRLVEARGIALAKQGKDWVARCPFHEEATPSLVVSPGKNLFHCFGCGAAGGPIDWVMKLDGVSFRHAVELLRNDLPLPVVASGAVTTATAPPGACGAGRLPAAAKEKPASGRRIGQNHSPMRTLLANLLICFGLLFISAGTVSGHVVVADSAPTATQLRNTPGIVTVSADLKPASGVWLDAATPTPIPSQVGDALIGKEFKTFDDLREAIWESVGNNPDLASGFSRQNISQMQNGFAPFAPSEYLNESGAFGQSFNIHHFEPISEGGLVYDLSNLRIVSPKIHYGIHYGP
ncbi:MAG: CHC2 zinc finger domain-containing protein [Rhodanobacter sp.]